MKNLCIRKVIPYEIISDYLKLRVRGDFNIQFIYIHLTFFNRTFFISTSMTLLNSKENSFIVSHENLLKTRAFGGTYHTGPFIY